MLKPDNTELSQSYLGVPSHRPAASIITKDDGAGYTSTQYAQKEEQMKEVMELITRQGFVPPELVPAETAWFYDTLGIDGSFFAAESVQTIANYIVSLYAAKVTAFTRDDHKLEITMEHEEEDHAVYFNTSAPGVSVLHGPRYEYNIDQKYISPSSRHGSAWRLETFRSQAYDGNSDENEQLRCYFVYKCKFPEKNMGKYETDLKKISDVHFYSRASDHTKRIYQKVIEQAVKRMGPVLEVYEVEGTNEYRLVIAYRQRTASGFFSSLSHLYHYYGLTAPRKYVEQFSNGITVMCLYLSQARGKKVATPIDHSIHQIVKESSLLYCLPDSQFNQEFALGKMSLQESVFSHCAWIFASHFVNRLGTDFEALAAIIDTNKVSNLELLDKLKQRLRGETYNAEFVAEIMRNRIDVLQDFYLHFANTHYVQSNTEKDNFLPTLSYLRLQTDDVMTAEEIESRIVRTTTNEHELVVLKTLLNFNKFVLKTNFYTPTKTALSFRFDPAFLPSSEYPQPLYGMFLIVGQEFRGFHLRFRDVARGGIRIVRSRNKDAYGINRRSMFDENYNLANTQQRKNKDIPEGGSKGVILLDVEHQDKMTEAFRKYIDAIIDLLIPGETPGVKEAIVDLYGKPEILFMGPDENTANLVDWATEHAKSRGAPWWKSFFTGKSPSIGGIPHDAYGMTSLSVREYVKGIYRKHHLENTPVNKLQTGGPDGDLGSNEILLSTDNERYIAIVDGSGVLADPQGLDKEELRRLAKKRVMISEYDSSKLSKDGYRVLVDDTEVKLPHGEVVQNGVTFRNNYHVEVVKRHRIDVFVPCGGRPNAINIGNVNQLIDEKTMKSKIPYIVEGANLFISQSAKMELEKAGAVVYKDASANKGGVTSSSLEVLASLAFDDEGFFKNMCVDNGVKPQFYKDYVKGVQERIKENARLEFEAIWRDHETTGEPRCVLSDTLSNAINLLSDELSSSNLWEDTEFRNGILASALPPKLLEVIGLDKILSRVPDAYLRAIFGSYLAGHYIYKNGTLADQFAFYEYMMDCRKKVLNK